MKIEDLEKFMPKVNHNLDYVKKFIEKHNVKCSYEVENGILLLSDSFEDATIKEADFLKLIWNADYKCSYYIDIMKDPAIEEHIIYCHTNSAEPAISEKEISDPKIK